MQVSGEPLAEVLLDESVEVSLLEEESVEEFSDGVSEELCRGRVAREELSEDGLSVEEFFELRFFMEEFCASDEQQFVEGLAVPQQSVGAACSQDSHAGEESVDTG